jgi:hypothetical protein
VKHREDDNHIALGSEVHGVRETPHQRSADSRPQMLVPERTIGNPVVGGTQLVQELPP